MSFLRFRSVLILAAVFFILGLFRLNDLSLYTDSTRYLIWGHSLSEFKGFVDDTQVVTSRFVMNAPLYALLLAPVEMIFPLSIAAAKVWTLIWGTCGLILLFSWFREHFQASVAFMAALFLAANPLFLTVSTEILSEAPFITVLILLLIFAERYFLDPGNKLNRIGFLACLATITLLREVGGAFVLAALIVLFRQKRGRDLMLAAVFSGGLFLLWTIRNSLLAGGTDEGQVANVQYLFQHFVTSQNSSIISEFATRAWLNLKGYTLNLGGRILFPFPDSLIGAPSSLYSFFHSATESLRLWIFVSALGAVVAGMVSDVRSGGVAGLFRIIGVSGYLIIILLYPVHDLRFLFPLVPLMLFYAAKSWIILKQVSVRRAASAAGISIFVLLFVPNAVASFEIVRTNTAYQSDPRTYFLTLEPGTSAARHFSQPWALINSWIDSTLPANAVIASPVKDIAPFVYPRRVLETSRVLPSPVFERFLRDFSAQYLITVLAWDSVETFELQIPESQRLWFEPLVSVAGIRCYAIHSSILQPQPRENTATPDTVTAKGLLLNGRNALLNIRYREALGFLGKALALEPSQPEIAFQIMTALSFLGDSVGAMNMVQQLLTLPQSTAFTQRIQSTLSIMEQNLRARRLENPSQRSFALFETGLAYWGLGYRQAARQTMHSVLRLDSTNFVGALWGVYFAKQMGDTVESNQFLTRLKRIDQNAQIAGDWDEVRQFEERLKGLMPSGERVRIHLRIAAIYAKIELFDEAVDACLRAVRLEPSNIDTWLYVGEVLEKKKARVGAAAAYRQVLKLEPHNSFAAARLDSLSS